LKSVRRVAALAVGEPTVRERLGQAVKSLTFDRALLRAPALSPQHMRSMMETGAGPLVRLVATLDAPKPVETSRRSSASTSETTSCDKIS